MMAQELFCDDPLELCKAGEAVLQGEVGRTLNEGQHIFHKFLGHAVSGFVDPLTGHLLLRICGKGKILGNHFTGIVAIYVHMTMESHHLIGHAVDSGFHRCTAGGKGLVDVGRRGKVRRAATPRIFFTPHFCFT